MNKKGYIWMMPKGDTFPELMTQLEKWPKTRALIDILGYADHVMNRTYDDTQLKQGFTVMNTIGLPLALEVGAVKPWGTTGADTFSKQKPMWDRFRGLGADIAGIVMDEPLAAVHNRYDKSFSDIIEDTNEARFEYAVEETAKFIGMVREEYPDWFVADIEVFPSFTADYVIRWIDALEARLKEKGIRGQDFFRMDVDWNAFGVNYTNSLKERVNLSWEQGWREVKRIEDHCRAINLPYSVTYWAANVPASQDLQKDPASWCNGIMRMGQGYQDAGGRPDQYAVQTWIGLPEKPLPETDPHSFTYSVLEFNKSFIPQKEEM